MPEPAFSGILKPAYTRRDRAVPCPAHMRDMDRKQMKQRGKASLKKHYAIFVMACLIAAFLGAEFAGSLAFSKAQNYEEVARQVQADINGDGAYHMVKTTVDGASWGDVLRAIAEGGTQAGEEVAQEAQAEEIQQAEAGSSVFTRTRGVLASVLNQLSSGSILVTIVAAVASITGSDNLGIILLIALGALLAFGFWFFVTNVFQVVSRRIFLEGMLYEKVTAQRFTFLLRVKRWLRASWAMLVKYVFYSLWSLTIVGALVKRYSYFLVPYLLAENPDIKPLEAITLSRRMMKGHKWECFIFELSFLGWGLLGAMTFGLGNVLFTNPYKTASLTQYYAQLRREAKEKAIPGAQLLKDGFLYEKPAQGQLAAAYGDVLQVMEHPQAQKQRPTGWRGFLQNNFGVALLRREQDRALEAYQAEYMRVQELMDDAKGQAYPTRLYPFPESQRRKLVQSLNYMRSYSIWSLAALFLGLSFFGWLWEVGLFLVSYGILANRGALHGPWLPIYGAGSVLILVLLYRFRKKPALEFGAAVVLCGFLEYMTSLVMELSTGGTKWWDYSGYFLNLNGRICAEGLLVFGLGGMAIVYVVAPLLDNLLRKVNEKAVIAVCAVLLAVFAADAVYSHFVPNTGAGVTDVPDMVAAEQAEPQETPLP